MPQVGCLKSDILHEEVRFNGQVHSNGWYVSKRMSVQTGGTIQRPYPMQHAPISDGITRWHVPSDRSNTTPLTCPKWHIRCGEPQITYPRLQRMSQPTCPKHTTQHILVHTPRAARTEAIYWVSRASSASLWENSPTLSR